MSSTVSRGQVEPLHLDQPASEGVLCDWLLACRELTETVGESVHVMDELSPPDHLADEPFARGNGESTVDHVVDHVLRQESMEVQERRDAGVEETAGSPGHGVLVRPEARKTLGQCPRPER